MSLDAHLAAAYADRVGISGVAGAPAIAALVEALKSDPDLKSQAVFWRVDLNDAVCLKCFISRTYRDILDVALAQAA